MSLRAGRSYRASCARMRIRRRRPRTATNLTCLPLPAALLQVKRRCAATQALLAGESHANYPVNRTVRSRTRACRRSCKFGICSRGAQCRTGCSRASLMGLALPTRSPLRCLVNCALNVAPRRIGACARCSSVPPIPTHDPS
jgi:hypothetical protein